jgi:hypothetical protein|tara:strand:+ start:79 stop:594 length:516 start_codon:yes stop_codon:yes gene_type:complete
MIHKHHIVPRHAGGTDDSSNIVELTVKEHAQAHKELYDKHGHEYDQIAYRMLSGQIPVAEATRQAQSFANLKKNKTALQLQRSRENFVKASQSNIGRKHNAEWVKKQSESNKKYWSKVKDRPWQKKTFIIEGKIYLGLDKVMKTFNCTMPTVYNRIKNPKFNWKEGKFKNE